MEFSGILGFLTILKDSVNLLPRNWRLITSLTVLYVLLSWILSYSVTLSISSLSQQIVTAANQLTPEVASFADIDPNSFAATMSRVQAQIDHITQITATTFALVLAFTLLVYVAALFLTIATVFVAAVSLTGDTASVKEVVSRIAKTWPRPLVTGIYVSLHSMGFFILVGLLAAPALIYPNFLTVSLAVLAGIVGLFVCIYMVMIWTLALVASVVEESSCYGVAAMGKASTMAVNRQRLNGCMLNLFFFVIGLIVAIVVKISAPLGYAERRVLMLALAAFSCAVKVLAVVAYTVLYFRCKEEKGEEIVVHDHASKYEILLTDQPMK